MVRRDLTFKITDKVQIRLDAKRNAVILFETRDGKSVQLEADYQTINKIHEPDSKAGGACFINLRQVLRELDFLRY